VIGCVGSADSGECGVGGCQMSWRRESEKRQTCDVSLRRKDLGGERGGGDWREIGGSGREWGVGWIGPGGLKKAGAERRGSLAK